MGFERCHPAVFDLRMIPLAASLAVYYRSYHHFGITVLQQNCIGNNMTLEALVYGGVLGHTDMIYDPRNHPRVLIVLCQLHRSVSDAAAVGTVDRISV